MNLFGHRLMNIKIFKVFAVVGVFVFLSAGLVMAWYGSESVAKFAGMVEMKVRYDLAEHALKAGQNKLAAARFRRAIAAFKEADKRPGYYVEIGQDLYMAGNCYSHLGKFQTARHFFQLSLEHNPNNINCLTNLGNIDFYRLGKYREAAIILKRCQKIYPSSRKVNKTLRLLHEKSGDGDLKWPGK